MLEKKAILCFKYSPLLRIGFVSFFYKKFNCTHLTAILVCCIKTAELVSIESIESHRAFDGNTTSLLLVVSLS